MFFALWCLGLTEIWSPLKGIWWALLWLELLAHTHTPCDGDDRRKHVVSLSGFDSRSSILEIKVQQYLKYKACLVLSWQAGVHVPFCQCCDGWRNCQQKWWDELKQQRCLPLVQRGQAGLGVRSVHTALGCEYMKWTVRKGQCHIYITENKQLGEMPSLLSKKW